MKPVASRASTDDNHDIEKAVGTMIKDIQEWLKKFVNTAAAEPMWGFQLNFTHTFRTSGR